MSWVRSLPCWVKWLAPTMVLVGLGLIVWGLCADYSGRWNDRPFATNIASGLASALVGIPTSVLLIATVLDRVRQGRIEHEVRTTALGSAQDIAVLTSLMLASRKSGSTVQQVVVAAREIEEFLDRRDSLRGPDSVQTAAALIARSVVVPSAWSHSVEAIVADVNELARARRLANANGVDFPGAVTDVLAEDVARLAEPDDDFFGAQWSYSGKVDLARLAISVRTAAENWLTDAARVWPAPK